MTVFVAMVAFLLLLTLVARVFGEYLAKVFSGTPTPLSPLVRPLEEFIHRLIGLDADREMSWKTYALAVLLFNGMGIAAMVFLGEFQKFLPLNPEDFGPVRWDTMINMAVSFVTNTNWQSYAGERTLGYLVQMAGCTVQNFLSAAGGMATAAALIRGFARKSVSTIGNFWVDVIRSVFYVLLPLAVVWALVLVSQGVVQSVHPYVPCETLEGSRQTVAVGPAASQVAIKFLGSNGGGFFNANSAHPFENPTPVTDLLEIFAMLLIPAAMPFALGAMVNDRRQGWAFFCPMLLLFLLGLGLTLVFELHGNPLLERSGVLGGVNMEGKEMRLGVVSSVLFGQSTTAAACGGVNSMLDSFMPLTGLVFIFNMVIGEVIFGAVGAGLIGMIYYAILTMFVAGLMIGRTPELLGKKLEPAEMIATVVALLLPATVVLAFTAIAVQVQAGLAGVGNFNPHGLSRILYAYASATGNNGSAFGGLKADSVFFNLTTATAMLVGRTATLLPAIIIAGSLARKRHVPSGTGSLSAASPLFVGMLTVVILMMGSLTFFIPASLGPILEHLLMSAGRPF